MMTTMTMTPITIMTHIQKTYDDNNATDTNDDNDDSHAENL